MMDRAAAGLVLGWMLALLTPLLGLANVFAQWLSCRPDGLSDAPADAVGGSDVRRPLGVGCDTSYLLSDGSTVLVPGPFDWSFVLLGTFAAGIALIVVCVRARRAPESTLGAAGG